MRFAKLFGAATLFASMIASAQAGTIVTVKVKNSTTDPAAHIFEYFSGSVAPPKYDSAVCNDNICPDQCRGYGFRNAVRLYFR